MFSTTPRTTFSSNRQDQTSARGFDAPHRLGRVRWAAIGAALAVSVGAGGVIDFAAAAPGDSAASSFVAVTPCRLVDTRPGAATVGPRSTPLDPNESYTQQVTGANGDCNVPAGATAVGMNVTITNPTAQSYLTVYPSDAALPNASNLNWIAGQRPTPNKVDVALSSSGAVDFFNAFGTVNVIGDVVGYYISADRSSSGVTIDGASQRVVSSCFNYPFQDRESINDAHAVSSQYLVEDPVDGTRRVIELWSFDDDRFMVVNDIRSATTGQANIGEGPVDSVTVEMMTDDLVISANVETPQSDCDRLVITPPEQFGGTSYGVSDVCSSGATTVLTLTSWFNGDPNGLEHGYSEFIYELGDAGVIDPQLRTGGVDRPVTSAEFQRSLRTDEVFGQLDDGNDFLVSIGSYPDGGHTCVPGQIAD